MENQQPLWTPSKERVDAAVITRFMHEAGSRLGVRFDDYASLHQWSIDNIEDFWRALWAFSRLVGDGPGERTATDLEKMPGARFFPDARINFAENLLAHSASMATSWSARSTTASPSSSVARSGPS